MMHNAEIRPVLIPGVFFYLSVNDTPIPHTQTTDLEIAMISYLRKRHIYVSTNHMKLNDLCEVKLSLKYRSDKEDKAFSIKEDLIVAF